MGPGCLATVLISRFCSATLLALLHLLVELEQSILETILRAGGPSESMTIVIKKSMEKGDNESARIYARARLRTYERTRVR